MHFFQVPILKVMSQENCPSTTKVTSVPWCLLLPLEQCNPLCTSQVHHCQAVHLLNQQRYPRLRAQSHGSMETVYNQLFSNETLKKFKLLEMYTFVGEVKKYQAQSLKT